MALEDHAQRRQQPGQVCWRARGAQCPTCNLRVAVRDAANDRRGDLGIHERLGCHCLEGPHGSFREGGRRGEGRVEGGGRGGAWAQGLQPLWCSG